MAALTNLSDIINRMTGGNSGTPENLFFFRDSRVDAAAATATVAGRMTSLWQYEGVPAGGAAPGAVAVPTNATDGSMEQANPSGGREKWLLGVTASSNSAGTLIVYDRLLHISGLASDSGAVQTVGGTLTRNTGGAGNQIWIEIYTIIGTTATTITASYTNQAGTSGRTTTATAIGGTGLREAQRLIALPLAAGDTGVQAVASITLAGSTLGAGSIGVTIARPLSFVPLGVAGVASIRDNITGVPTGVAIDTNACISFAWLANGVTAPQIYGSMHMIEA